MSYKIRIIPQFCTISNNQYTQFQVCAGDDDGDHEDHNCQTAGDFFVLGGANEMPWEFHYPFYFDISDAALAVSGSLDGHYHVVAEVFSVNGTSLGRNILPKPYGAHRFIGYEGRLCVVMENGKWILFISPQSKQGTYNVVPVKRP